MSHTNETLHYHLPQYVGSDIVNPLVDTNDAYSAIDNALYEIGEGSAEAVATANEVKESIEGTGGVNDKIVAIGTRLDAVEAKDVSQDASILALNSGLSTTDANLATVTNNVSTLDTTVAGHTTSIGQLNTRVGACENVETSLNTRVTALENASPIAISADNVSFNDTSSHLTADNVQDAILELDAEGHALVGELQTTTLATGATSATVNFTQEIKSTTIITPVCSIYGVSPTAVTYTAHSITLTFEAQASDAIVGARIQNVI